MSKRLLPGLAIPAALKAVLALALLNLPWATLLAFSPALAAATPGHQPKVIIAVDDPYVPPITCKRQSPGHCIIPEILTRLFKTRADNLQLKPMSTSRQYIELGAGRIHGAVVYTTPQMPKTVFPPTTTFCPNSVFDLTVGLYTLTNADLPTDSLDALLDHQMTAVRLPAFQRHILGTPVPNIIRTNNIEQSLKLILAGRADYTMYENFATRYRLRQMHAEKDIIFVRDMFDISYHLALSTTALRAQPNLIELCEQLDEMKQNGTVDRIIQRALTASGLGYRP